MSEKTYTYQSDNMAHFFRKALRGLSDGILRECAVYHNYKD
jgi:hypothetical protein